MKVRLETTSREVTLQSFDCMSTFFMKIHMKLERRMVVTTITLERFLEEFPQRMFDPPVTLEGGAIVRPVIAPLLVANK